MTAGLILAPALMALVWFDLRERRLPDGITLLLMAAGLAVAALAMPERLDDCVIGALVGGVVAWSLRAVHAWASGRIGLGLGDVKLIAAAGAWVGWQGLPEVVLVGCASALVGVALVEGKTSIQHPIPAKPELDAGSGLVGVVAPELIPFGAHLCLGLAVVWAWGPWLAG